MEGSSEMNEVWKGHCPCPSDTSLVRPYTRCPRLVGAKKENVRCQDEEDCGFLMSGGLLVPSGCHSEYWPLGDFNKVNLLSPSSRGLKSRSGGQQVWFLVRWLFLVHRSPPSPCVCTQQFFGLCAQSGKESSLLLL